SSVVAPATPRASRPPLSLHDALPIWPLPQRILTVALAVPRQRQAAHRGRRLDRRWPVWTPPAGYGRCRVARVAESDILRGLRRRSEEHTSELQSRFDLVCRLLLEKKK